MLHVIIQCTYIESHAQIYSQRFIVNCLLMSHNRQCGCTYDHAVN